MRLLSHTFLMSVRRCFSLSGFVRNSLCLMLINEVLTYSIAFSRTVSSSPEGKETAGIKDVFDSPEGKETAGINNVLEG